MEEERLEEMTRVVLKPLEAMGLHSSMHGKRWPCPKKGTTQISLDIFGILLLKVLVVIEKHLFKEFYRRKKKEKDLLTKKTILTR